MHPPTHPSNHPSIHPSFHKSINPTNKLYPIIENMCIKSKYISWWIIMCIKSKPRTNLSIHPSSHTHTHPYTYPPTNPPNHPSIHPSVKPTNMLYPIMENMCIKSKYISWWKIMCIKSKPRTNLSIYLSIYLRNQELIYPSINPSIHPATHTPTHPPRHQPTLSIYLSNEKHRFHYVVSRIFYPVWNSV